MSDHDKIGQARQGAAGFATEAGIRGYAAGLVTFSDDAIVRVSASKNIPALQAAIGGLRADGSTNMAAAIRIATAQLSHTKGNRLLYIVSDGEPNDREETLVVARRACDQGIEIMTLSIEPGDPAFLASLASRKALAAHTSSKELGGAMKSMAKLLPSKAD